MANLNRVFLIGNLTRDPELRYVPSGTPVATIGLATNRVFTTQSGEKREEVCFIRVVVWGKQAESCSQYLHKGSPVFIEGRLVYRTWESNGQKRSTLEVRADRVQFLGRGRQNEDGTDEVPLPVEATSAPVGDEGNAPQPFTDDDIPF